MSEQTEIRLIKRNEIPLIKDFPPVEWHMDLSEVYQFHFGEKYFHPAVAVIKGEIAGTGIAILNQEVAWLGTIIVKEQFRNKGLGTQITRHLVDWVRKNGGISIVLFATELGIPVYKKLGFEISSYFSFYKNENPKPKTSHPFIHPVEKDDLKEILNIDFKATGEKRDRLIEKTFLSGFKYVSEGRLKGFYLPVFGKGLIIAEDEQAGMELIQFKNENSTDKVIIIPELNIAASEYLKKSGFEEDKKTPRMFLGKEADWKPEMVFGRGSGYMG